MAWLGAATGLGVLAGPAFGAWLSIRQWLPAFHFGAFSIGSFSTSFFLAALLALVALTTAAYGLPESLRLEPVTEYEHRSKSMGFERIWTPELKKLLNSGSFWGLLGLSFLTWFSLPLFEGTFALHGQQVMKFGRAQMGMVFMVCGLVMAVGQAGIVGWLIDHKGKLPLLSIGFSLVGIAFILLMLTEAMPFILIFVGVLASGMALLIPTLATLVSRRSKTEPGTPLGLQTAVNSLGRFAGPLTGGLLLSLSNHLPYLLTAGFLLASALLMLKMKQLRIDQRSEPG